MEVGECTTWDPSFSVKRENVLCDLIKIRLGSSMAMAEVEIRKVFLISPIESLSIRSNTHIIKLEV